MSSKSWLTALLVHSHRSHPGIKIQWQIVDLKLVDLEEIFINVDGIVLFNHSFDDVGQLTDCLDILFILLCLLVIPAEVTSHRVTLCHDPSPYHMLRLCVIHIFGPAAFNMIHSLVRKHHRRRVGLSASLSDLIPWIRLNIVFRHVWDAVGDCCNGIAFHVHLKVIFIGPKVCQHHRTLYSHFRPYPLQT